MPPSVAIIAPAQPILRGDPATFSARVTDDQTETPTLKWGRVDDVCTGDATDKTKWPADNNLVPGITFTVDAPLTKAPFCVWAIATDRYGAAKADHYSVTPGNHPPTAKIDVVSPTTPGPYAFQSVFVLSGINSHDADLDTLSMKWTIKTQPAGSTAGMDPCPDSPSDQRIICVKSDIPGTYEVDLTVSDATDSATASVMLVVLPDQLPCIVATDPSYGGGSVTRLLSAPDDPTPTSDSDTFSVLQVKDDLDGWPDTTGTSLLHFSWSLARGDAESFVSMGPQGSNVSLPLSSFHIGDNVRLRVEISDRNNSKDIQNILLGCHDEDTCGLAGCLLRVTWRVDYR